MYKPGQIVNFSNNHLFAKLIKFRNLLVYGELGWSHSAIITDIYKDHVLIHEALSQGFVSNKYEKWWLNMKLERGEIAIGTSKVKLKNVLKCANNYKGRPYAWWDIFNIFFSWISGRSSLIWRFFKGPKYLICSEAVARVLYDSSDKKLNLEEEFNKPYDMIEPTDLFKSSQLKWIK